MLTLRKVVVNNQPHVQACQFYLLQPSVIAVSKVIAQVV